MVGLLDGGIAAIFGAALGGLYLDGTLVRSFGDPIYDGSGNITGYGGGDAVPIKYQLDKATDAMRREEGYIEGDAAAFVLMHGLPVAITTDHRLSLAGVTWLIKSKDADAASSHYVLRVRET